MKIEIKNVGRRKRELWIDDKLAGSGRLNEIEQQVRIMKMLVELEDISGGLKGTM